MRAAVILCAAALMLWGCEEFRADADAKFGDQSFKTAVALIELHKVRTGQYPESLKDIRFTGEWDAGPLHSVEYHRLGNGYELNILRGWIGKPELSYPPEFWRGLGILKSNVRHEG